MFGRKNLRLDGVDSSCQPLDVSTCDACNGDTAVLGSIDGVLEKISMMKISRMDYLPP